MEGGLDIIEKSKSRIIDPEFMFLHPKMLYHIMNHIKMNGSIDATEMLDLLNKFSDINTAENVTKLPESEYVKYARYGLDSLKETISRHREGRFDKEG